MKEAEVLQRINDVDAELIEEASIFSVTKRKTWKRLLPLAASFLLIVGVLSGWLYYISNKAELDENGKIDIYSIKRAQVIEEVPETEWSITEMGDVYPREEYIARMKARIDASELAVVYGTVKNIKMVAVEDRVRFTRPIWKHLEDGTSIQKKRKYNVPVAWVIVTFDIDVLDDLGTLDGRETVHVVMASRYATGDTNDGPHFKLHCPTDMKEMVEEMQRNPTGLFMLRNLSVEEEKRLDDSWNPYGNIWKVKGKEYHAIEFADYYVNARYDCDGERYHFAGAYDVMLEELRRQEE